MRILVACEYSGTVRDAFRAVGHDAISCDLEPTEQPGPHFQGDVREMLAETWDMVIGHPPCQFLSYAGLRHWHAPGRAEQRAEALAFALILYNCNAPRVCIENPKGHLGQAFRPADQYVNPFDFGEPIRKRTGLWLRGLPALVATDRVAPAIGEKGSFRGDKGVYRTHHHIEKKRDWKDRSRFFPGIAAAMAAQWGDESRLARFDRPQLSLGF